MSFFWGSYIFSGVEVWVLAWACVCVNELEANWKMIWIKVLYTVLAAIS